MFSFMYFSRILSNAKYIFYFFFSLAVVVGCRWCRCCSYSENFKSISLCPPRPPNELTRWMQNQLTAGRFRYMFRIAITLRHFCTPVISVNYKWNANRWKSNLSVCIKTNINHIRITTDHRIMNRRMRYGILAWRNTLTMATNNLI